MLSIAFFACKTCSSSVEPAHARVEKKSRFLPFKAKGKTQRSNKQGEAFAFGERPLLDSAQIHFLRYQPEDIILKKV
jgi:hypothetical protein